MNIKCHVYQAKSGLIYLSRGDGRVNSVLTLQQVAELGLDLYSLDDFSLKDFKNAYPAPQSPQEASEGQPASVEHLEQAVGAMLETGIIQFTPSSWCSETVSVTVSSVVFTEKEMTLSVNADDWNGGPTKCIAKELAQAITANRLKFIPCTEKIL